MERFGDACFFGSLMLFFVIIMFTSTLAGSRGFLLNCGVGLGKLSVNLTKAHDKCVDQSFSYTYGLDVNKFFLGCVSFTGSGNPGMLTAIQSLCNPLNSVSIISGVPNLKLTCNGHTISFGEGGTCVMGEVSLLEEKLFHCFEKIIIIFTR